MNMDVDVVKARDLALEIEKTINSIEESMHDMHMISKKIVDDGIHTDWADRLLSNLDKYMQQDLAAAIADMKLSVHNIYVAADLTLKYSQEK